MALSSVFSRLRVPSVRFLESGSIALGATRPREASAGAFDPLAASIAALQQQHEEVIRDIRAATDALAQVTLRESQLRSILRRDAELEQFAGRLDATLGNREALVPVKAAIEGAELHLEPFPYVVVDNCLPPSLYKSLLKGLPPLELFADKPPNKQELLVPFVMAPAYSRKVWRFLSQVVIPEHVTPAVLEKFQRPVVDWIGGHWPHVDPADVEWSSSDGRVMLRGRGYRIQPHRDPKWGFITCLLYLARPGDAESWGTQFYAVDEDREARGAAPHWIDPATCRLVADIPFRPNRMLVFLNSAGAHGAHIPADAQPENLERYAYQFRIGPSASTITQLIEMLPDDKREFWAGKLKSDY